MIIKSQVLKLGIKVADLTVVAADLCFSNAAIIIQNSYAQFSMQLDELQQKKARGNKSRK